MCGFINVLYPMAVKICKVVMSSNEINNVFFAYEREGEGEGEGGVFRLPRT